MQMLLQHFLQGTVEMDEFIEVIAAPFLCMLRIDADQHDFVAGHDVERTDHFQHFVEALFIHLSDSGAVDQDIRVVPLEYMGLATA